MKSDLAACAQSKAGEQKLEQMMSAWDELHGVCKGDDRGKIVDATESHAAFFGEQKQLEKGMQQDPGCKKLSALMRARSSLGKLPADGWGTGPLQRLQEMTKDHEESALGLLLFDAMEKVQEKEASATW